MNDDLDAITRVIFFCIIAAFAFLIAYIVVVIGGLFFNHYWDSRERNIWLVIGILLSVLWIRGILHEDDLRKNHFDEWLEWTKKFTIFEAIPVFFLGLAYWYLGVGIIYLPLVIGLNHFKAATAASAITYIYVGGGLVCAVAFVYKGREEWVKCQIDPPPPPPPIPPILPEIPKYIFPSGTPVPRIYPDRDSLPIIGPMDFIERTQRALLAIRDFDYNHYRLVVEYLPKAEYAPNFANEFSARSDGLFAYDGSNERFMIKLLAHEAAHNFLGHTVRGDGRRYLQSVDKERECNEYAEVVVQGVDIHQRV